MKVRPQVKNANRHTQRGMQALEQSLQTDGWIGAITVAADGETFDGSARVEKTAENGMLDDPIIVESDGTRPIVVKRTDIPSADDPRAKRLSVAANRVPQLNLDWEPDVLSSILDRGVELPPVLFSEREWSAVSLPPVQTVTEQRDWGKTPEESYDRYMSNTIRQITLHYELEEYTEIMQRLTEIRTALKLETNTDVVTHLLRNYHAAD